MSNKIVGGLITVTVLGVIGVLVYKRYQKQKNQEGIITVSDLKDILANRKIEDVEIIEEEEEGKLRKGTDPNSEYALDQYIKMQTADFVFNSNLMLTLRKLYEFEFEPQPGGDVSTKMHLLDDRVGFFGPDSQWSETATWADLILYYAKEMDFNLGEGIVHWTGYIVDHINISSRTHNANILDLIDELTDHSYINGDSGYFGLFGLDDEGYEYLTSHLENAMDGKVTFERECNAFLYMITHS